MEYCRIFVALEALYGVFIKLEKSHLKKNLFVVKASASSPTASPSSSSSTADGCWSLWWSPVNANLTLECIIDQCDEDQNDENWGVKQYWPMIIIVDNLGETSNDNDNDNENNLGETSNDNDNDN